jgi:hypothetical protein
MHGQSRVVHSLSLSTAADELHTISMFWQLQPFTDDAVVDALFQAAEAAAGIAGQADHI